MVLSEMEEKQPVDGVGPSQISVTFTPDCKKSCPVLGMSEGPQSGPLNTLLTLWEVAFWRWTRMLKDEAETLQSLVEMSAFLEV